MPNPSLSLVRFRLGLPLVLLGVLLAGLWIAGGASRADAAGQIVVRGAAIILLIVMILFGNRPDLAQARPVWLLLGAAIALPLFQMIPLPPNLWQHFPGRDIVERAAVVSGQSQSWRPLSMVPGASANAVASLIVPLAALVFACATKPAERPLGVAALLAMVSAATFMGLLQFSGAGFDNPFVNESPGLVSGNFANRNHFALFLAIGCLLAPAWAVLNGRRPGWRGPVALGLVLLFMLTLLASGSRAGLLLGPLGMMVGLILAQRGIRQELRRFPGWVFPALLTAIVGIVVAFVLISVAAGRAESINRAIAIDPGQDMRGRGLSTVLAMIREYFPVGTGMGSFDPMFRINEPFGLLKLTYFNHAHNDFLEIGLDAGLPGMLLMAAALLWWTWASARAWRPLPGTDRTLPRLGSGILLLILIASVFDYPARTPIVMAVVVLAAHWLADTRVPGRSALP